MNGAPAAAPGQPPLVSFLLKQLEKYNVLVTETHQKIYSDLSNLKDTMVENIDKVGGRGSTAVLVSLRLCAHWLLY